MLNMVSQSSTTSFSQRGEYCKAYVPYYQMALTTPLLDPEDIFEFEGQNQISKVDSSQRPRNWFGTNLLTRMLQASSNSIRV